MDDSHRAAVLALQVVRVVERVERLVRDPRGELRVDTTAPGRELAKQCEDIDAIDVLHRDEQRVVDLPELEGLGDLGVDEASGQLRFVDEHRVVGLVRDEVRQEPLDHDFLLETVLAGRRGDEQLGHTTNGKAFDELVPAEAADRRVAHEDMIVSQALETPAFRAVD